MNNIAPTIVLILFFSNFLIAQKSNDFESFKSEKEVIDTLVFEKYTTSVDVIFEFVSGRVLDLKTETKDANKNNEYLSSNLMYKSKLVKRLYKKIAHLNESTC
ncbi:MAG: hypothetical protein ACK4JX_01915 [Flavobacterium sp.]